MKLTSKILKLAFVAVAACATASAIASPVDSTALVSTRETGNQAWTGALGIDFNVVSSIWVTQLGAYDSGANGFSGPISVGIYNRDTGNLVGNSAVLTTENTSLSGYNRFFDVTDFILTAGNYSIVADGFSDQDKNGNTGNGGTAPTLNTGDGLISFTGSGRYGANTTSLFLPNIIDGGPANRYDAGTFQFHAVPEPTSLALLGLGLVGLGALRQRKQK